MAIARTLMTYLEERDIRYGLVEHKHTETALDTAHAANVPAHQVAKAVVLCDDAGYVVSVLPANHSLVKRSSVISLQIALPARCLPWAKRMGYR